MKENFYTKLFFVYYCAAKKYNDDFTAIFYSSVLLGGMAMFILFIIMDIFVILSFSFREFIKLHYNLSLYMGISIAAIIAISSIIFFRSNDRYKTIAHHHRFDLSLNPGLMAYLKIASLPLGLWVLMMILATYVRHQKWFY